jgi:HupE/UreJ protein
VRGGALRVRDAAAGAFALLAAAAASGHPLAPSLLELEEQAGGRVLARFTAPRAPSGGARALPVLPERCRPVGEARARAEAARVVSEQLLDCGPHGLAGAEVGASGLAETASAMILRVVLSGGGAHQALLVASRPRFEVPEGASAARVLEDYGRLGAAHLAGGIDHLLFVAGLFLLVPRARALVATLSAFTLGHSATLSLAALGAPSPPAALVEAGIAASLVALALELAKGARGPLAARPAIASGALGLLHGMGFAGALRAIGLPADAVPLALFSFNAGIELAQLAFVAALGTAALALRAARLDRVLLPGRSLACHALGGAGAFLFLERVAGALAP